jgi:ribosomal-protein-alanine N-acetyltransferase
VTAPARQAGAAAVDPAAAGSRCRPMQVTDLDAVMAIEAQAYSHPWTRGNFIDSLAAGYRAEVMPGDGQGEARIWGYSLAMAGVDETHLLNLTVAPALRRRGLGLALLARVAADARARGDQRLWLEVRASTLGAQALYRCFGFAQAGLRRRYYPAERFMREDAVVMSLALQTMPAAANGRGDTANGAAHALD